MRDVYFFFFAYVLAGWDLLPTYRPTYLACIHSGGYADIPLFFFFSCACLMLCMITDG